MAPIRADGSASTAETSTMSVRAPSRRLRCNRNRRSARSSDAGRPSSAMSTVSAQGQVTPTGSTSHTSVRWIQCDRAALPAGRRRRCGLLTVVWGQVVVPGAAPALCEDRGMAAQLLIVEDDDRIRAAMRLALEDEGYEITEADDAETAISIVRSISPDVMIVDLMLGSVDGFTCIR